MRLLKCNIDGTRDFDETSNMDTSISLRGDVHNFGQGVKHSGSRSELFFPIKTILHLVMSHGLFFVIAVTGTCLRSR